jgi:hypothetical protein
VKSSKFVRVIDESMFGSQGSSLPDQGCPVALLLRPHPYQFGGVDGLAHYRDGSSIISCRPYPSPAHCRPSLVMSAHATRRGQLAQDGRSRR